MARHGGWAKGALFKNYLQLFDTHALLALGDWPEGAQGTPNMFWHERFHMHVPEELIVLLFPFLPALEKTVYGLRAGGNISVQAVPEVLRSLAVVVVQDSLELVDLLRNHPVHQRLAQNDRFQCALMLMLVLA